MSCCMPHQYGIGGLRLLWRRAQCAHCAVHNDSCNPTVCSQPGTLQAQKELARSEARAADCEAARAAAVSDLAELSTASRGRIRALVLANEALGRRAHTLNEQLLAAVPAQTYYTLLDKYKSALSRRRDATLANADRVAAAQQASAGLERQLLQLEERYTAACASAADASERARVAESALTTASHDGDVPATLSGQLRQRAVELAAAEQKAQAAERKAARQAEEAEDLQEQLQSLQQQHAHQANCARR